MIAPRYRASVRPTGHGTHLLTMVAANGCGGASEHATQAEALAAAPALYAEITGNLPPARGLAAEQRETTDAR